MEKGGQGGKMDKKPSPQRKRSSRIAESQVYIWLIYLLEKIHEISLISKLAQQAKNPVPEGAVSIYVDPEEIEWKRCDKCRKLPCEINK